MAISMNNKYSLYNNCQKKIPIIKLSKVDHCYSAMPATVINNGGRHARKGEHKNRFHYALLARFVPVHNNRYI